MKLGGTLVYNGIKYFVAMEETKGKVAWHIISDLHQADLRTRFSGERPKHTVLNLNWLTANTVPEEYIIEGVSRNKLADSSLVYKGKAIISDLTTTINSAAAYRFADSDITENVADTTMGTTTRRFAAKDSRMEFRFSKIDNFWRELYLNYGQIEILLTTNIKIKTPKKLSMMEVKDKGNSAPVIESVASIDYQTLKQHPNVDLSWYEVGGQFLKEYIAIETIEEFERLVIEDMIYHANLEKSKGRKLLLSLDTETNGLVFNNLSPTNEERNVMVAIPISWKDDFAAVIFVDMAFFDNVPIDYVLDRLKWFIGEHTGEITIERRFAPIKQDTTTASVAPVVPNQMSNFSFGDEDDFSIEVEISAPKSTAAPEMEIAERLAFDRDYVQLIGHNILFDAKVFKAYDIKTKWHDDTLQMAFNLNPKVAKGSNKLKSLTRRIWGFETPELSDILGKGNEAKFRLITDKRVAVLYGGADADFTRMVYKYLEMLTPPKMLAMYRKQDIDTMNEIIVDMDYYGMNTDYENMVRDAEYLEKDLEKLRNFLFNYVGVVVDHRNKVTELYIEYQSGVITHDEYMQRIKEVKVNSNAVYKFDIAGNEIREVMYKILNYPVLSYTKSNKESVDKFAIKKLLNRKASDKHLISLPADIKSANGEDVLLEKDKFNSYAYPVAYVLQIYATLYKEYTSYYKPMIEQNLEGRIFKSTSFARIETRRIMNPGQTMKKNLKRNIIAYTKDHYLFDFDQSQVEYRIMASISNFLYMIDRLRDPEKDYHIESASNVYGIKAHTVTKDIRSGVKGISFGLPYGLGEHKLCANLNNGEVNKQLLYETRKLIEKFKATNRPVIDMLEKYRGMPLKPLDLDSLYNPMHNRLDGLNLPAITSNLLSERTLAQEFHRFLRPRIDEYDPNVPYGRVESAGVLDSRGEIDSLGFYRLFDLSNMDNKKRGSIERPAGNFPIQNFAAELFRLILNRFVAELKKYNLRDKTMIHMLIHDECLGSAHKDIHPFLLYKIIMDSCVIQLPGHTTYYVGINIGPNWEDCKKDTNEAPMLFVDRMVKRWDAGEFRNDDSYRDDVKGYVGYHKHQYLVERIWEVLREIQPDIDSTYIDYPRILDNFENYTVRSYVSDYFKPNASLTKDDIKVMGKNDPDRLYMLRFESWVIERFGEGKEMKYPDGMVRRVVKSEMQIADLSGFVPDIDFGDEDESDYTSEAEYWTFDISEEDGEEQAEYYFMPQEDIDEEEEFLGQFDFDNKEAKNVGQLLVKDKRQHKHVRIMNDQLIIKLQMSRFIEEVKEQLVSHEVPKDGYLVMFETPTGVKMWNEISKSVNLDEIDSFVEELA